MNSYTERLLIEYVGYCIIKSMTLYNARELRRYKDGSTKMDLELPKRL